jgi:pimeloyl-ACP methyl ester carboxylesterase
MPYFEPPYFPVIYVRGYAMTSGEIADTVATPYMGFNHGATKVRQTWDGKVVRHVFESPLIRLMKDYGYRDIYANGAEIAGDIPSRSVIIYRYYDTADEDLGNGKVLSIPDAARGLKDLIDRLRKQMCGNDAALLKQFRVHLVAHSMGGLVVRSFLQNDKISSARDRALVCKVFTYATPHNGIEMAGMNVPAAFGLWDMNNFNRSKMAEYLGLPKGSERVDTLGGKFDTQRFFCFVGTNHRDYTAAAGLSRKLAGEMSDGLVKIENATVDNAPRAFAYRSHSGHYGVVNSEEGYQNLVRFLFGDMRVDGVLEIEDLPLPPSVEKARQNGKQIKASYYFEATVAPRGALAYRLTERRRDTYSAILREYDELLKLENTQRTTPRFPVLFSAFLDTRKITAGKTVVFSLELQVSSTGYTIDNKLWLDQHVEGEYLFRDTLTLRATQTADGFNLRYLRTDENWSENTGTMAEQRDKQAYAIPLSSDKGFKGTLVLKIGKIAPSGEPMPK